MERLQRLIGDFSTLARMPKPKLSDVQVHQVLEDMAELFNSYRNIHIQLGDEGQHCFCDSDQLRQVLINLLDNAVGATTPEQEIRLYVTVTETEIEWHIEDDGEGIGEDAVSRLFEAYFSTKASGSGLGLAIAKRIVEDHGGELLLLSRAQPTHFCLRLPRYCQQMEAL